MPNLSICGGDLVVLVEGPDDLTFVINIAGDIDWGGSVRKMESPVPIGTAITDHIVRDPDKVSFNGILACLNCATESPILTEVLPALKVATSRHIYNTEFYTVTSNLGVASNMVLMTYSVRQEQHSTQKIDIAMTFEAANIAGSISAPSYDAGGIVA